MTTLQVEREPAIAYLVEQTPAETLRKVYEIVTDGEGTGWPALQHFGLGMWVRNRLRERFAWDDVTLDREWSSLIEAAARRAVRTTDR